MGTRAAIVHGTANMPGSASGLREVSRNHVAQGDKGKPLARGRWKATEEYRCGVAGRVAQQGERQTRSLEVGGSSPPSGRSPATGTNWLKPVPE